MFQGFQKEASDFFWEMCFNNEREWFHAHKEQYDTLIGTPMKELANGKESSVRQVYPNRAQAHRQSRFLNR